MRFECAARHLCGMQQVPLSTPANHKCMFSSGAISGRLQWFECYAGASLFYQKVAKPLLSMGTVGSMDCERRAKALKHTILTKKRNRMKDETGVALLRGHENLRHLLNAKKLLGKQIHESLLRR